MPESTLANFLLLPELRLNKVKREGVAHCVLYCIKEPRVEYCPRCATPSVSTYDHRSIRVKDAPIHGSSVVLVIRKRRLWCKPCAKPFTEPVPGIKKNFSHTERYGRELRFACDKYSDLKAVKKQFRCSNGFLYNTYYRHVELRTKSRAHNLWPSQIGIDEHAFGRQKYGGFTQFASLIVNHNNKKVIDVVEGKKGPQASNVRVIS
mgnify:CR=1 FL=1